MTKLRPLSVGEIVDRATSLWREHWKSLFRLLLGFQLLQYVSLKVLELVIDRVFPALRSTSKALELAKQDPQVWLPQFGQIVAGFTAVAVLNLLLSQIAGVAVTAFVFPRMTGTGAPTVAEALRRAVERLTTTVGLFGLSMGWSVLVGALFLVPGALAFGGGLWAATAGHSGASAVIMLIGTAALFFGLIALFLWFLIRFVLASQVLAIEPVSAFEGFRRTDALSSGRVGPGFDGLVKGRLTLLITIIAFILTLIGLVTGFPELLVMGLYGEFNPAGGGQAPQALIVPTQLLQVIAGAAVAPLYVVFQVVFYVDMRVRREGLDLELATKGGA